ncbi:MAG: ABC transporter ATP-binding protein/permease, partial [Spirochaetes bacterium]|nr:ABC transporter ATP-binding protein/permease [Spirochaetota bacterium]
MSEHWSKTVLKHAGQCKGKMTISVLCAIVGVFGGLVPYYGVYNIVIILTGELPDINMIIPWILVCLSGYIIRLVFHSLSTVLSHISAYTILNTLRLKMSERLMGTPLGVVLSEKVGRLKNAFIDRIETIELPIAHMIPEGFSNLLLAISVFIYLITVDFRLALAAIVTAPISFIIVGITLQGYTKKYQQYMRASDHVNSVIVEYSEGIEVIKMFNHSDRSYEKYEKAINEFRKYILDWGKSVITALNFSMALLPTTLLGLVPVGIILYRQGSLTPAEFVLCIILAMGIVPPLMNVSQFVNNSKLIQYAVKDSSEFLNIMQLPNNENFADIKEYNISFKDVCFSYNADQEILKNINININENSFCALIGPSGSGKSTMARLIARFWDVTGGRIAIGGVDVREIPLKQLSACISFVAQDNFLFDCTLRENIRM